MKILHVCLAAFYIDNFGYQENILPKMHFLDGHDVRICASTETYIDNKSIGYIQPGSYRNEHNIQVVRLPYISKIPKFITRKLRIYSGLKNVLEEYSPDIIFIHDCQFLSIHTIVNYVKRNVSIRVYVDGHTDYINSGRNFLSKHVLNKIIYKSCAKAIEKLTTKFYGTLPLRNSFFRDVYEINPAKIELLPFGADHSEIDLSNRNLIRRRLRKELGIGGNTIVVTAGGKIDKRKNFESLISAIELLFEMGFSINLILFGVPNSEMIEYVDSIKTKDFIHYVGWKDIQDTYRIMVSSDIACFPGTHSVLWEQCLGVGLPCIFRRWDGMQHLDRGNGNCIYLSSGETKEIQSILESILTQKNKLEEMKRSCSESCIEYFSYQRIARFAINENE